MKHVSPCKVFTLCSAPRELWSRHVYSDHDRNNLMRWFDLGQTKHVKHGGRERRGSECPKILNWGYNETQLLFHTWADDEIHGQLLVMIQNPASPCKRTKTHADNRYKLLSLSQMGYVVPKIAQIPSSCNDLRGPSPQNECHSKFQFHSSVLKV